MQWASPQQEEFATKAHLRTGLGVVPVDPFAFEAMHMHALLFGYSIGYSGRVASKASAFEAWLLKAKRSEI